MGNRHKVTLQYGRDIFNNLNTYIERDAIKMYLISDFMNQLEYKFGSVGHTNIVEVFNAGFDYINGVKIEP